LKDKKVIVIQYEQFFDEEDAGEIKSSILEALQVLQQQAGARVIGSYEAIDNESFRASAVSSITIKSPVIIDFGGGL